MENESVSNCDIKYIAMAYSYFSVAVVLEHLQWRNTVTQMQNGKINWIEKKADRREMEITPVNDKNAPNYNRNDDQQQWQQQ